MAVTERAPLRARDNPFAVDRVIQVRYLFRNDSIDALRERIEANEWRGAIVGPEGSGKTTLLEDIAQRLASDGWQIRGARLSREQPRFDRSWLRRFVENLGPRDLVAFDGAEQLSPRGWRRFQRLCDPAGGLLITTHQPGLLRTVFETHSSPEILDEILADLWPAAPAEVREVSRDLFVIHGGNVRNVLRSLYDLWADGQFAGQQFSPRPSIR